MTNKESYQKWEKVAEKYKIDNSKLATFELTAENALKLLSGKNKGTALDVGCGNGLIDIMLAKRTGFEIIGCDISNTMLAHARANLEREKVNVRFERQNVYNLVYPDNYFDVIFSFGYVSAATYLNAREEIFRVLKPRGLLICDFINHYSLYKLLFLPKNIILGYAKIYEFSEIKKEFEKYGFKFISKIYFNTYPPILGNIIPVKLYILFEKTIGKLFRRILGRVILTCFQKQ